MPNDNLDIAFVWRMAHCDMCRKPYTLVDLNKMAAERGRSFLDEKPRFYFACCYEPTIEDNDLFNAIVDALRKHYGV